MSLIERALEKARIEGKQAATRPAAGLRTASVPAAESGGALDVPSRASQSSRVRSPQLEISEATLAVNGLRAPDDRLHQQMAEFRHVKRQLLSAIQDSQRADSRLLLVTSAIVGDGKTYSAANLALSLALERDYYVLLVDADVIKASLSGLFGLGGRPGLMDAVANDDIDVESLVVDTSIERLSILPAGSPDPQATEYFASARMGQVLSRLLGPADRIVVVDSLPLLQTTEVRSLLRYGGQVMLVVRANETPHAAVMQAVELLDGHENVSLLLNAMEYDKLSSYLGYGYQYSYNYGGTSAREKE
jgi:protein-tyrosine kinase